MATDPDLPDPPERPDLPDGPDLPERPDPAPGGTLEEEVRALRQEMTLMRQHRMFLLYQSVPRVLLFRFASGMAVGLGTVIGATVLLSVIVSMLSQIEFIPIIGEWSVRIAEEIEALTQSDE